MTTELLLRYLHFICIFAIVGALVAEHLLLKPVLSRQEIARLARIDAVYGLAAIALAAVGLTLWLGSYGKPAEFYSTNPVFHTKLTLFVSIGLLSVYPTVFFLKHRKGDPNESINVPSVIFWLLRLEILCCSLFRCWRG
jgi:putative membrane protein